MNNKLEVVHFDQAIDLLKSGNCLVDGQEFDMSDWNTCLCGSARVIAGLPKGQSLPEGWVSGGDVAKKLHIAAIVMMCSANDEEVVAEWDKRMASQWALRGANLSRADLCKADLSDANLREADLSDADLRGADLRGADLREADLRDADLRGADLRSADLREADLRDADLRGADLRGADLRGADLRDADLDGADLDGVREI